MLGRETELSILYEISSLSTRLREIDDVVALTLDKATRLLGAEVAILYLKHEDDPQLYAAQARGILVSKVHNPLPVTSDTADLYAETRIWTKPAVFPYPYDPLLKRYPVQSTLGVPLRYEGALYGWLYVGRLKQCFEERQIALYRALASQSANALELIRGRERDKQQREALTAANQQLELLLMQQEATIRELSTPVLNVADHVVLLPLIGRLDSQRSNQMMETLLQSISTHQASVVILDITGVSHVDTLVANVLLQATHAAKLLGAQVVLCGVNPRVAQVLIDLNVQLGSLKLTTDLQTAMGVAFAQVSLGGDNNGMSFRRQPMLFQPRP